MFRIVQSRSSYGSEPGKVSEVPYFWLVCDDRKCGVSARADIPQLDSQQMEQSAAAAVDLFTRQAASEGWLLAVDGHFCPHCYKEMVARDLKRQEQLQRMQSEMEALKDKERGYNGGGAALVQIGGTPQEIKRARELEERRRRLTTGLKQGVGPKEALQ